MWRRLGSKAGLAVTLGVPRGLTRTTILHSRSQDCKKGTSLGRRSLNAWVLGSVRSPPRASPFPPRPDSSLHKHVSILPEAERVRP